MGSLIEIFLDKSPEARAVGPGRGRSKSLSIILVGANEDQRRVPVQLSEAYVICPLNLDRCSPPDRRARAAAGVARGSARFCL